MSIDLEQAKTSDDAGSMASMREKHRQSRQVLVGHPNDPTVSEEPPEVLEKEVKPPDDEVKEPSVEQPAPSAQPLEKEEKKYKYSSQEEAERAYAEAQKKMHEATTENAELKRQLEEIKSQPAETAPQPPSEEVLEEVEKTWAEIDDLDPYDKDYVKNRAQLFTKLLSLQSGQPKIDDSYIDKKVEEKLEARRQEDEVRRAQENEERASRNAAVQMATEAGLNMDDGNTQRLFWAALANAPFHEGVTLKDQVAFMVKEVKDFYSSVAKERGEAAPQQNLLERGGKTPIRETEKEEKPKTLAEMKEGWRERRRI